MLPENDGLLQDFKERKISSLTYELDENTNTITSFIDEKKALIQSMSLMLNIERYLYSIYSKNYGSEIYTLIGENMRLAYSQVERYIRDALSTDNRIIELKEFKFCNDKRVMTVEFVADTIYGETEMRKAVSL